MALKEIRQKQQLSQSQLALESKVNIKTIQAYEQEVKNINNGKVETLLKLAIALDCRIIDILTDQKLKKLIYEYERMHEKC